MDLNTFHFCPLRLPNILCPKPDGKQEKVGGNTDFSDNLNAYLFDFFALKNKSLIMNNKSKHILYTTDLL